VALTQLQRGEQPVQVHHTIPGIGHTQTNAAPIANSRFTRDPSATTRHVSENGGIRKFALLPWMKPENLRLRPNHFQRSRPHPQIPPLRRMASKEQNLVPGRGVEQHAFHLG
jgi:hypothetical protein